MHRGGGVIGDELCIDDGARLAQQGRIVEEDKTLALTGIAEGAGRPRTSVVASGQRPSWPALVHIAEELSYRRRGRIPACLGPVTDPPGTHRERGVRLLGVRESRSVCGRRRCSRFDVLVDGEVGADGIADVAGEGVIVESLVEVAGVCAHPATASAMRTAKAQRLARAGMRQVCRKSARRGESGPCGQPGFGDESDAEPRGVRLDPAPSPLPFSMRKRSSHMFVTSFPGGNPLKSPGCPPRLRPPPRPHHRRSARPREPEGLVHPVCVAPVDRLSGDRSQEPRDASSAAGQTPLLGSRSGVQAGSNRRPSDFQPRAWPLVSGCFPLLVQRVVQRSSAPCRSP